MAGLPGSIQSMLPAGQDELVRRMRDLERRMDEMGPSVAPSFSPVIADLAAKQAALEAQVAFLGGQTFGYTSGKDWDLTLPGVSGTGAWELQAYDPTYDDEYVFQASSTGILEIQISATVMVYNASATKIAGTCRGYSLSWPGWSLPWIEQRSARFMGEPCGVVYIATSDTTIVTVSSNATVTLQTRRAKWSPTAPDTTLHGTRDTTVVVTRIGI